LNYLQELNDTELAHIFSALAGETRIRLLQLLRAKILGCSDPALCDLSERCCNVSELAGALDLALSTVSYHLRELRLVGLIQTQRRGKHVYCSINEAITDHLAQFFIQLGQDVQRKMEVNENDRSISQ